MNTPHSRVTVADTDGRLMRPWYLVLATGAGAPRASVRFVVDGLMSPPWYRFITKNSAAGAPQNTVQPLTEDSRMSAPWFKYLSRL